MIWTVAIRTPVKITALDKGSSTFAISARSPKPMARAALTALASTPRTAAYVLV
jgi:hypothetical protein